MSLAIINAIVKKAFITIVLLYLRFFAHVALKKNNPIIIGISGTVGKSSTRDILYSVLKEHIPVKIIHGNSETGIPLGILGIDPSGYTVKHWIFMLLRAPFGINYIGKSKYLIVEMGVDDPYPPKNMDYLLTILKPDIAIDVAASTGDALPAHAMQFEKILKDKKSLTDQEIKEQLINAIAKEDAKIITDSKCHTGIYNADDTYITRYVTLQKDAKLLSFGSNKESNIIFSDYSVSLKGTSFGFTLKEKEQVSISLQGFVLPLAYRSAIAASLLTGYTLGLSVADMKKSLEKNFYLPKGRASIFPGIHNTVIIDSSYNASRVSVIPFLTLVKKLKQDTKRKIVFLFGDMRELGSKSQVEHENVAREMVGIVDFVYLVGQQTREYVLPVLQQHETSFKEIRWFANAKYLGEFIKQQLPKDTIILVKGSQNTIFLEEAIKYILADKNDEKKLCRQENYWKKF